MKIIQSNITLTTEQLTDSNVIESAVLEQLKETKSEIKPIRFVVVSEEKGLHRCEVDTLIFESDAESEYFSDKHSIFNVSKRKYEDSANFTTALLIPTGIGAELGGHCGDGNVAARLLANACDTLITHPNVVNASDLNEMTENTLYVEGGTISDLFNGSLGLQTTRSNRILMLMDTSDDRYFNDEIINAVSSARVTLGVDCDVYEMPNMIESNLAYTESGRATAEIHKFEHLLDIIKNYNDEYDAFALATIVQIPEEDSRNYFESAGEAVNPWGGSEAIITHSVGAAFAKPTAHSPLSLSMGDLHVEYGMGVVDPRKAPESASVAYLHCILKGLHRAPRIVAPDKGINQEHLSCLVLPEGCFGLPVLASLQNDIPVIVVKNQNVMKNDIAALPFKKNKLFFAENYLEAAGIMNAIQAGVSTDTLVRPISFTNVL